MTIKELFEKKEPPCAQCPYKLGLVETVVTPCPLCKANDYRTFEDLQALRYGLTPRPSGDAPK